VLTLFLSFMFFRDYMDRHGKFMEVSI